MMEQPKTSQSAQNQAEPEVQVLSRDERDSFQGLTLDQQGRDNEGAGYSSGARYTGRGNGIHVKTYGFSSVGKMSWITKIAIGLVILAIVSGAAVIGGVLLLAAAAGWIISRLFRR